MADVTNNTLNAFFKNRVKFHAASRLASQTGEGLAQALNVDGHIVTYDKVWSAPESQFPNNADKANVDPVDATNDLIKVFKSGYTYTTDTTVLSGKTYYTLSGTAYVATSATISAVIEPNTYYEKISEPAVSGAFWNGGAVWTNTAFPAVKLYEDIPMTPVKGSDGGGKFQSFEVLADKNGISSGNIRIADWVAPTAVADRTTGKPVAGFSGIYKYGATLAAAKAVQAASTAKWAATLGTWEFVYMAGLLQFEPLFTPQDLAPASVNAITGKTYLYLTAFKYCGEYLADTIKDATTDISAVSGKVETNTTDISAIKEELEDLTVQAGAKEIATVNAVFNAAANSISGELEGLSGTISGGVVNVFMPAKYEILNVKEDDGDLISPDIDYATSGINIYADYGTATLPSAWTITYRV